MAFSPAWGGAIPLVPIGSFKGFLGQRRKGKELRQWYTTTITRAVVATALKTAAGKRVARDMAIIISAMGFKTSDSIAIELQGYIAFQKFQHQQAVAKRNRAAQKRIEKIMALPGDFVKTGPGAVGQFPLAYFETLTQSGGGQTKTKEREERKRAFHSWLERRKRRKGRLVNV